MELITDLSMSRRAILQRFPSWFVLVKCNIFREFREIWRELPGPSVLSATSKPCSVAESAVSSELRGIMIVNRCVFRVPPESSGGGAEKHAYELANNLAELGNPVYLISRTTESSRHHPLVELSEVPPRRAFISPEASFFGWLLKHFFANFLAVYVAMKALQKSGRNVQLIHAHSALAALILAKLLKERSPILYTMHDPSPWIGYYSRVGERLIRKLAFLAIDVPCLRSVSHVIAVSPALRKEVMRWGVPSANVTFIPSGVTIHPQTSDKVAVKEGFGLFVGRLEPRKGLDLLLTAVSKMKNMPTDFVVVGNGPLKDDLIRKAHQLGIADKILFTGYIDDVSLKRYYSTASFFVFPSSAEGLPLVLIEAMSFGLPVIAPGATPYQEIVTDHENGLVFDQYDPNKLKDCILKIESDQELAKQLSRGASHSATASFSWTSITNHVLSLYETILPGISLNNKPEVRDQNNYAG